ncbi:MAG: ketoacyl-ACP synthase III [Bacteroidales bacterium]|nr:ketoacyl-ACP synthase III [Bacteroidales bacterium]
MKIIGTGSALPKKVVTNDMLSDFLETNDEWITTRTGIKTRHIVTDERFEDLATEAAGRAIDAAGLCPDDIDYIVCSNVSNLYITPHLSSIIMGNLGIKGPICPTMDVNAACVGFVQSLDVCDALLATNRAKHILLVAAEECTRFCDWNDRNCAVLFGDGAGAVVLGKGDNLLASKLTTTPMPDVIVYRNPMEATPFETREGIDTHSALVMKGREVFRMAVTTAARDIAQVTADAGLTFDDIDHFLLHQANLRINEAIRENLKQPESKFPTNVQRFGNTSSASIPLLLDEGIREGRIKHGDTILMSAFGAGFVSGIVIFKY